MKNKYFPTRKDIAFSQIFLLVISIVAFTWAIGSEVGVVSGEIIIPKDVTINKVYQDSKILQEKFPNIQTLRDFLYANYEGKIGCTLGEDICVTEDYRFSESFFDVALKIQQKKGAPLTAPKPAPKKGAYQLTCSDGYKVSDNGRNCLKIIETKDPVNGACEEGFIPNSDKTKCVKLEAPPQGAGPAGEEPQLKPGDSGFCDLKDDAGKLINAKDVTCASALGILGESALFAAGIYGVVTLFGPIFGLDDEQTKAISEAGALGVLVGNSVSGFGAKYQWGWASTEYGGVSGATYAGLLAAGAYFLANYRDEDSKKVQFSCVPWQAGLGGDNCEVCNQGFLPCSEYQCKSLGQSCELVNPGTTDEKCVWVNRNDVTSPIIEAWIGGLLNADYRYNPDAAILPPDRGVKVEYLKSTLGDNCIPAFTPLRIGISSNEPAKCKIDGLRKNDFETMDVLMSGGLLQYNHTFSLSLPGSDNLNSAGIEVQNDGNYDLFVRCEDANGNANEGTFVFKYCVDKGPDVTPPLIVATSIPNNAPVAYNQTSLNLEVYVNEPSECKWSHNNREYDSMEVQMSCDTFIRDNNAQGLYTCRTTLEGIKDRFVNKFFFRCKDKPQAQENERNVNQESFEYKVIGTQALVIDYALPNDTIRDSTSVVKVTFETKTSAGFDEGKAECFFSDTGDDDDFTTRFLESNSHLHKQELFLPSGSYVYYIRCIDLGGNRDDETITFSVESDDQAPIVVRAYHEEQYLKLITNEEAKCVYDVVDCSYPFDSGIPITEIDGTNHFTDWNINKNLYIKCQDAYGNQPLPNQCSIIVKSSDF
ncbi:hypothetical protein HYT25_03505 [Candidatus Pacearchaeota archaeon]|nr:hypothetical protein [Candidatus Pacearchaeota archaeon]